MPSVRRVRRIVRKIDPWTVLKVSFVFYAVVALAVVLGSVILWAVARTIGIPQGIDEVAVKLTLLDQGDTVFGDTERWFLIVVFVGVVWTVLLTGLTTLAAVMYNLVSDIVGGVEVVVLEESLATPPVPIRTAQQWSTSPTLTIPVAEDSDLVELPTAETEIVGVSDETAGDEPDLPETEPGAEDQADGDEPEDTSEEYEATASPDRTAAST